MVEPEEEIVHRHNPNWKKPSIITQLLLLVVMGLASGEIVQESRWGQGFGASFCILQHSFFLGCLHICGSPSIMLLVPGFLTHHSCADLSFLNSVNEIESQEKKLKVSTSVAHQESPAEEPFTTYRTVRYCRYCKNCVVGPSLSRFWKLCRSTKSCSFYSAHCWFCDIRDFFCIMFFLIYS
ncbi:uncharacterized protein LOC125218254 [Salvia hispanica]|uniref:uncharacterized protein LOC125218254 n=1 Tax=Salvia hispanica TaxID=49212 RepID=UPI0020099C38|nr:uncharacterized protein LOC125218254 [Salvia hispanica]